MTDALRCPSCRSVQVDASEDDYHCRVCKATWRPSRPRTGDRDYVRALRHDRYDRDERKEPGEIWKSEA
jgi:hypothetical protein